MSPKGRSHRQKANARKKKMKVQSEEIKRKKSSIKEIFRFRVRFRLV